MEQIKNIIFDLGGVFLNIDFLRTEQAFAQLGFSNFKDLYTQSHASELFILLETGKISPEEFHLSFINETGIQLSFDEIKRAWNALLLDFPKERLLWLNRINKKYNTYLFSNTNQIHYESFKESFYKQWAHDFDDYFKKAYYSHQMGLRKPDASSFLYIINEQKLVPEQTLFIDDTLKNIEGAFYVGLKTFHLQSPKTLESLNL